MEGIVVRRNKELCEWGEEKELNGYMRFGDPLEKKQIEWLC